MNTKLSLLSMLGVGLLAAASPSARANLGDTIQRSVQRYGRPTVVKYDGPNSYAFRDGGRDIYEYFNSDEPFGF